MYDEAEQLAASNLREAVELQQQDRERHYSPKVVGFVDEAAQRRHEQYERESVSAIDGAIRALLGQFNDHAVGRIAVYVFENMTPAKRDLMVKTFNEAVSKDIIDQARWKRQSEREEKLEREFQERFAESHAV